MQTRHSGVWKFIGHVLQAIVMVPVVILGLIVFSLPVTGPLGLLAGLIYWAVKSNAGSDGGGGGYLPWLGAIASFGRSTVDKNGSDLDNGASLNGVALWMGALCLCSILTNTR